MSEIVTGKRGNKLASIMRPIIYQEYTDIRDLITPFIFGTKEESEKLLPSLVDSPTLYYGIREDEDWVYAYYLVYHPFDWTSTTFMKSFDEHQHDTESILVRFHKKDGRVDIGTVSHHAIYFQKNSSRKVTIEAETHAILPFEKKPPGGNYLIYQLYKFIDLNKFNDEDWNLMRDGLGGHASMPQEQKDSILSSGMHGRKRNKPGDIFLRPEVLFKSAEQKGKFL
jgi:hypothetical protein